MRLQEQNDTVASWSDTTITKLKQIIARVLVETEYLDNLKADHLNPVWLHPILENAIRSNGDAAVLPAMWNRKRALLQQPGQWSALYPGSSVE